MGTLEYIDGGARIVLRARCLFGRSSKCEVRTADPRVSSEHASLRWTGEAWELRDLASKNGTFLDGRRLGPQERAAVAAGAVLSFGAPARTEGGCALVLVDAAPPLVTAVHLRTGVVRTAESGLLLLPDDESPRVSLLEEDGGRWRMETVGETRFVSEEEVVLVEGESWQLDLPSAGGTIDASPAPRSIEAISLAFRVSRDEERVEVRVEDAGSQTLLPPRSCQYLLLTLARARLSDAGGGVPSAERGWVDRDALCRMLNMDEYRINVDVCRARKQFAALGIHGAGEVVQRRVGTGRLRLGVERLRIQQR